MNLYLDDLPTLDDWEELGHAFASWTVAWDLSRRVLMLREDNLIALLEQPGAWRARHRRALHRLGFRPQTTPDGALWEWTPCADDVRAEVGRGPHPRSENSVTARLMTRLAEDRLRGARCVAVMRDVFGLTPSEVRVADLDADDEDIWDEAL